MVRDRIEFQKLESSWWVGLAPVLGSVHPLDQDRDPDCLLSQAWDSSAGALSPSLTPPQHPVSWAVLAALGGLNRGAMRADLARAPAGLPAPHCVGTGAGYVLPGLPRTHRARHTPKPSGCASSRRLPGLRWLARASRHPSARGIGASCLGHSIALVLESCPRHHTLHKYPGHSALLAVPWAQHRQPQMHAEPEIGGMIPVP